MCSVCDLLPLQDLQRPFQTFTTQLSRKRDIDSFFPFSFSEFKDELGLHRDSTTKLLLRSSLKNLHSTFISRFPEISFQDLNVPLAHCISFSDLLALLSLKDTKSALYEFISMDFPEQAWNQDCGGGWVGRLGRGTKKLYRVTGTF